jgi:hypothetical protein
MMLHNDSTPQIWVARHIDEITIEYQALVQVPLCSLYCVRLTFLQPFDHHSYAVLYETFFDFCANLSYHLFLLTFCHHYFQGSNCEQMCIQ